jgi:predicted RNA binding protein YcfA (HicA-like mRNA interferase family)
VSGRAETRKLIRKMEKQGILVERTNGGHWRASRPGRKDVVIFSFSPRTAQMGHIEKRAKQLLGYKP